MIQNQIRCDFCDQPKSKMWGTVCNECREVERRHKELCEAIRESASLAKPHEIVTAKIEVDAQGISFGDCWISHEAIAGERPGIVKTQYEKWFASLKIPKDGRLRLTPTAGGEK